MLMGGECWAGLVVFVDIDNLLGGLGLDGWVGDGYLLRLSFELENFGFGKAVVKVASFKLVPVPCETKRLSFRRILTHITDIIIVNSPL